jgi:UDP-N-acetylglucosamine diphosphorylase/glucosamine-1-phosphate N-acetyltransferase
MKTECCFFEDDFLENFHPLTLTRPVYDLRVGILTLAEKWLYALNATDQTPKGILRNHLKGVFQEFSASDSHQNACWVNPRFIPTESIAESVLLLQENEGIVSDGQLIAAVVSYEIHQKWNLQGIDISDISTSELESNGLVILKNSWELFQINGDQIRHDIDLLKPNFEKNNQNYPHAIFTNPDDIYIEKGAVIEPGAMLLADKGPIYVGKNASIMANSIVRGPSAICEKSVVKMGAKIYEDTTVGPVCKVGGEIANTIFHSYSNKAHDGYVGNSVFGQWCNLGADTNTSNLKNNYSTVKVMDWKTQKQFDTGQQFIGTIMGDHSKTGINSMLNTGTLCGVCCNLFSDKYPPKYVPSFSWVSGSDIVPYHFDKAVEAMERMMERRSIQLTSSYHNMMKALFQSTSF